MSRFSAQARSFIPSFLLAFSLWLAVSATARAQSFGSTTLVTADSNVLNTGNTVLAYDVSTMATTVNGVSFSGSTTNGTVTLSLSGFPAADNNGVDGKHLSTSLTNTLIDNIFNFSAPASLTLNHLTAGTTYNLQVFAGTTGVGFGSMYLEDGTAQGTLSFGTTSSDSQAYFTTETFTAGSSGTETLNFVPIADSFSDSFVILDAVNLQVAAPEPSTWALMLAGVVLLVGAVRFRTSRA